MRAPNSDLEGPVLDDLALGRGGKHFNGYGGGFYTAVTKRARFPWELK